MKARSLAVLAALFGIATAQAFPLTILHVNDTHSRIEPTLVRGNPYGGMARLATLAKQVRQEEKNVLFLHAGDAFQGTLYYNVYKGAADGLLLNMLGLDAMALGNHEFDDGPANLLPFVTGANFPIVSANLDFSGEPGLAKAVKPWTVVKVGKEKIAVIGLMTSDLPFISSPGDTVRMLDLDQSLTNALKEIRDSKLNKVIVLSHCGYSADLEIAKNHPEIDLIVGGHSHSFLGDLKLDGFPEPMGPYPTQVGSTLVVQAWEWAKIAGLIQVDFDRKGVITKVLKKKIIPVDSKIPEDPAVLTAVRALQKPIQALQSAVVGNTPNGISRDGAESPMGNFIADAQLEATKGQKTVIALMNRGGIRASIEPGPITYGEAISVQPFSNTLVVLDVTGSELKETLEIAAKDDRLIQVSRGFQYVVNPQAGVGKRIELMTLDGAPIELTKTYRIVVNSFMAKGGDGFTPLRDAKGLRIDTGFNDVDALIEWIRKNPTASPKPEGRIKIVMK